MAESSSFDPVQTRQMMNEELAAVLQSETFDPKKVQEWCQNIVQRVLKKLVDANKNQDFQYKYVVNAVVLEKTGFYFYFLFCILFCGLFFAFSFLHSFYTTNL